MWSGGLGGGFALRCVGHGETSPLSRQMGAGSCCALSLDGRTGADRDLNSFLLSRTRVHTERETEGERERV